MGLFVKNEESIYNLRDTLNSQDVLATQETMKIHTVRKGEHLSTIAKRYGCTVADIKSWNGITSSSVKAGRKLTIYMYGKKNPVAEKKNLTKPENNVAGSGKFKYYTVQKGDSLYKIAQKNNTTVEELKRLNNIGAKYSLMPGKKIKIATL
jgi:membrane-bound lytic murein transglycosylase D